MTQEELQVLRLLADIGFRIVRFGGAGARSAVVVWPEPRPVAGQVEQERWKQQWLDQNS